MLEHIAYTDTFFSELNPHLIRCSALMRGFQVPDSTHFTYCELGCGTGHSLLLYAAANPHARFIGIDLSAEHIQHAQQRAQRLGIINCEFICADLTTLNALPICDYIVMHGLYSWVNESVQKSIHQLIESSITKNGLVLVSYNAYPGWHVYEPMLRMFREYSKHLSDDPFQNAEQGLGFLQWMHEKQSPYMQIVPSSGTFIEELSKHDMRYIIHEYYADHWSPLWFKEMNQRMQESNLSFAGQIPFYLNIGAIALPEGFEDILEIGEDVIQFEMYKDFIRNTMFRWDVYARGTRDIQDPFAQLHFGRVLPQKASLNAIQLPGCRVCTLDEALHNPIIDNLESGLQTSIDISQYSSLDIAIVEDALLNLLTIEQIKPIPVKRPVEADIQRYKPILLAYLEEALMHEEHVIPCLFSGSGIIINKDTAILLLAMIKHQDDAIDWIAEWMEIHGYGDIIHTSMQAEKAYQLFESTFPFWKRMHIL